MTHPPGVPGRGRIGLAGRRSGRPDLVRQDLAAAGAVLATVTVVVVTIAFPAAMAVALLTPIVVLAGLFLSGGRLVLVDAVVLAAVGWVVLDHGGAHPHLLLGSIGVLGVLAIMAPVSAARVELGLGGVRSEHLLVDLRDRLRRRGRLPQLPPGWVGGHAARSAYGHGFSGDLVVTHLDRGGSRLQVLVVDVSGKGVDATARALQLQAALGGLLGAVAPDAILPAANDYLLAEEWQDGFATAIHLELHLRTGSGAVRRAGHPPAVLQTGVGGPSEVLAGPGGPLLGVIPGAGFPRIDIDLPPGATVVLHTDGLVEMPGGGIEAGTAWLCAQIEASRDFAGLADQLVRTAPTGEADDRAAVVLHRSTLPR